MPAPETKYRPYFTLADLKLLQSSVHATISAEKMALNRYLNKYIRDIEESYILPAHTTNPRKTLEEKLELSLNSQELADLERQLFGGAN